MIAEEWTPFLAALQAAGELIAVPLGGGFYGVCLITGESALDAALWALHLAEPSPSGRLWM